MQERTSLQEQIRKEEESRLSLKEEEHLFKMKDLQMQLERPETVD